MFLESKYEKVFNMMTSVIEFASVLMNFSFTVMSVPLITYTVQFTTLKM